MNTPALPPAARARLAAAVLAIDPAGTGAWLRVAGGGLAERAFLALLRAALPAAAPLRRVPPAVGDDRLHGGLDLAATLSAGHPVLQRGLLAEAVGGLVVLPMAERLGAAAVSRMLQGEGARPGFVALDESRDDEPPAPAALRERLAIGLDLRPFARADLAALAAPWPAAELAAIRAARPAAVQVSPEVLAALCEAAAALGIGSLRAPLQALAVARALAALRGAAAVDEAVAALAAGLVLAPRATTAPAAPDAEPPPQAEPPAPPDAPPPAGDAEDATPPPDAPLEDLVLEAALAALPPGMLARLRAGTAAARARVAAPGRAGATMASARHGPPIAARRGRPGGGARLALLDTLRAAAPWQRLRQAERGGPGAGSGLHLRMDDLHVIRRRPKRTTTTVFVVDASGSAALHRLAEAKGAVELMLADCYVRRDRVAVIAFRGAGAELLLAPTRSLVRAKRGLAGLPGGGGTPLAAGIDAACALAEAIARRGETPTVVLLTDGRANIARDGTPGRARAAEEALAAARMLRAGGHAALWIDTSPQPQPEARTLAAAMGASYLPLPHAGAHALSRAVREAPPPPR